MQVQTLDQLKSEYATYMQMLEDVPGDENDPKIFTPIFFSVLTFFGLFFMGIVLINAKKHKYKSISSLINISILSSFMTAYQCYCFLFNLNYFIMNFYKPQIGDDDEYPGIEIAFNCIYLISFGTPLI